MNQQSIRHRSVVIIPSLNPTVHLLTLLDDLSAGMDCDIVVVNDGSDFNTGSIFSAAAQRKNVHILTHPANLGKGEALKTAFRYCTDHFRDAIGVVTMDADGQHLVQDVKRVVSEFQGYSGSLILGSRSFDSSVPYRSLIGNRVTSRFLGLVSGLRISDTQTGLRAIPISFLPKLLTLSSRGYDFETEMLVTASKAGVSIKEVPIETVYLDNNSASHFNPLFDSLKIYFVFLRFSLVSLLTFFIDYVVFTGANILVGNLLFSFLMARLFAGIFNFRMAYRHVFKADQNSAGEAAIKYVLLVLSLMACAYGATSLLVQQTGLSVYLAKGVAEMLLFFTSFAVQRLFVFRSRNSSGDGRTNWDLYYDKPFFATSFTRRVTLKNLLSAFRDFKVGKIEKICEFGGANSCFFEAILHSISSVKEYCIVDLNRKGIGLFLDRATSIHGKVFKAVEADVTSQDIDLPTKADVVYSVGLIEHFDKAGTALAIRSHFRSVVADGLVVITFPTPTWLYRISRAIVEALGRWEFPDERPLDMSEVLSEVSKYGEVVHSAVMWGTILTQGIVVIRSRADSGG